VDFVIATSEGVVSIDNQPLGVDTTSLPTNVAIVAYDCSTGAGNIEYNDRLRILEPLLDPTPYQTVLNNWLVAANALTTVKITLAQAKRVKIGIVNGIYNGKRQLPVTAIGHTWDASDTAYADMQAAITSSTPSMVDSLATQTNTAVHSDTAIQSVPAVSYAAAGAAGTAITYVTGGSQGTSAPYTVSLNTASANYIASVSGGQMAQQPQYVISNIAQVVTPTSQTTARFTPLNETVALTLNVSGIGQIVSTIQARRSSLQTVRVNKTNEINALLDVAHVIAYDATSGWPS
jgi:hypothetical protein